MKIVDLAWPPEPCPPSASLTPEQVHVWAVTLDAPRSWNALLGPLLSEDEWSRAAAFRFERHRRRFVVARGALRRILAAYTGDDAGRLCFSYGARGKPELVQPAKADALRFNLSHSADLAICALTRRREIGVDVEHMRAKVEFEGIVERFFCKHEVAEFFRLAPAERREAFFRLWTRKEAYMKARGDGFSRPPSSFDVSVGADEPPRLLEVPGEPLEPSRWSIRDLEPAPGFKAAVVVEGRGWDLLCRRWQP